MQIHKGKFENFFIGSALNLEYATIVAGYLIKIKKNDSYRCTSVFKVAFPKNTVLMEYCHLYLSIYLFAILLGGLPSSFCTTREGFLRKGFLGRDNRFETQNYMRYRKIENWPKNSLMKILEAVDLNFHSLHFWNINTACNGAVNCNRPRLFEGWITLSTG